uniref:C2H2-type domain-containing protein n=1 Tax=Myripristis murdjan TaxID=586833 RepID=A0A667WMX0_9TELE
MNGAVYISFFQGQLESVLEQVVQLAVQEISKTVGSSLNSLLLETAAKDQENQRLRLRLQSKESAGGAAAAADKASRTKPEPQQTHAPGQQGTEPGVPADTRRLEQRGRVVGQLKTVMQQVLDFALCELTKIVEASFDDLLLEITKMEREQQLLEERLGRSAEGSENDSASPSGSEDAREEPGDITESKETKQETNFSNETNPDRPPVLSVSQDWVPILDKVFGQKWCSDVWQIKELGGGDGGGREGGARPAGALSAASLALEPSPTSPQQDPRWTPLEDMEVLSPDDDDNAEGIAGRRSSASMLHRLLTLPSQLLEDDDEDVSASETLAALANEGTNGRRDEAEAHGQARASHLPTKEEEEAEEEEEGEEGEEEEEDRKKRRRVWLECDECGRRFSRASLLKAHRHTHNTSPGLWCSECGKRFSSATRLQAHIRTHHPGKRS